MGVKNIFDATQLGRLRSIRGFEIYDEKLPRHIAMTIEGLELWRKRQDLSNEDISARLRHNIVELVKSQFILNIPIITLLISEDIDDYFLMDSYAALFGFLKSSQLIHRNQIKISVLGKWYDAPTRFVEEIKQAIDATKDYDRFFFNFCLNYNGQEEITDACKLIARKIKADKIEIESITKELIKENLYSSYFLPPDIIIKTGFHRTCTHLLLWDSPGAFYCFPRKSFLEITEADFLKAVSDFCRQTL
ncbi:MAG: undecaprenyl diphosphate synthase family protein [Candidatus Woesearchaeota archaeon]